MKGMTQEELARAVHVTKGAIGNYESEVSSPKEPILISLMKVLGVDANFLFQDLVDIHPAPPLTSEELRLVSAYRAADQRAREDALEMLLGHPQEKDKSAQSAI